MYIRLGYVSITKTLDITTSHTMTYKTYKKIIEDENIIAANKRLETITNLNLENLIEILKYNIKNNIHFYRMSSNIFPLATHPQVEFDPLKIFEKKLIKIGKIITTNNMRVDIHLDQFCILNSTNPDVIRTTINIIKFHKNMLNLMNIKTKMILHIGSSAFGKEKSITRFLNNFKKLDIETQKMIIIENDDKIYNIADTLKLCNNIKVPMVLDYHHHICNNNNLNITEYINKIIKTWGNEIPKIHFSSPKNNKEKRSHNDYINIDDFIKFIDIIKALNKDIDIMFEAKAKDFALFKLIRQLKYKNYKFIDETTLEL